jgi:hypothetical protein
MDIVQIFQEIFNQNPPFWQSGTGVIVDSEKKILSLARLNCEQDLLWLQDCDTVEVTQFNGEPFVPSVKAKILEIFETSVRIQIVQGNIFFPESGSRIIIKLPKFVHGIKSMAEIEITDMKNVSNNIVYLYESFATEFQRIESVHEYISKSLRIYFMSDFNQNDNWLTDNHYERIIRPMKKILDYFVSELKKHRLVDKTYIENNTYNVTNLVKIGNGEKALFSRNLSAVELNISIAVNKDLTCINNC